MIRKSKMVQKRYNVSNLEDSDDDYYSAKIRKK